MKQLLVSGCSFTAGQDSWASTVARELGLDLVNLACGAAGNQYIAASIIDYIVKHRPSVQDTMVMVMWSGAGRRDARVSGEYWFLLHDYPFKTHHDHAPDSFWVFSGGRSNSWRDHAETRKLFESGYLTSDPFVLVKESLQSMSYLRHFLDCAGFTYKFMSYANQWNPSKECLRNGDFSLAYFGKDLVHDVVPDSSAWIFGNKQRDSLHEFCLTRDMLAGDGFHPSLLGQTQFALDIILPQLKEIT